MKALDEFIQLESSHSLEQYHAFVAFLIQFSFLNKINSRNILEPKAGFLPEDSELLLIYIPICLHQSLAQSVKIRMTESIVWIKELRRRKVQWPWKGQAPANINIALWFVHRPLRNQ